MMDLLATVPYYTAYLSKALLAKGVDVTVGSISYYLDPECFSSRGLRLDPGLMDVVGRYPLPQTPRRILKLLEGVVNLTALSLRFLVSPPEIVHVQYLPMLQWPLPLDLWFMRFCGLRGSKILLTVHDLLPHDSGDRYRRVFHDLYRRVDGMICHSDSVKKRLEAEFGVPEEKISVIPHGPFFYDLETTSPLQMLESMGVPTDAPIVLWQGIIFPYKGVDLLLNAWKHVEAQSREARLVIAGTGSQEILEQIRAQIASLGLKRVTLRARFVTTEELVALYRAAAIVVYPYRAITTSGALATGLALGKTIVASDLPVFRELLTDRQNALLIHPEDDDELAGSLLELLQNAGLREELAVKVRAMNFGDQSWAVIAEETVATYKKWLHR